MEFKVRGNPGLTSKSVGSQVGVYVITILQISMNPNILIHILLTTRFLRAWNSEDIKLFRSMDKETGARGVSEGLTILKREHGDPKRTR